MMLLFYYLYIKKSPLVAHLYSISGLSNLSTFKHYIYTHLPSFEVT